MNKDSIIYITGGYGMVGSNLYNYLVENGYTNVIRTAKGQLDLCDRKAVFEVFMDIRPEYVFMCAAKVGGIHANMVYPVHFLNENLAIQQNTFEACYANSVKKVLFLGSSCIYPKNISGLIEESHLLSGPLEPTNIAYAIAKISGIIACDSYNKQYGTNYIAAMPTNLYGPGDNYHSLDSHFIPALIRKFHEAKINNQFSVNLWGTGTSLRDIMYVKDCVEELVYAMNNYDYKCNANRAEIGCYFNVSSYCERSIKEWAEVIAYEIVGYRGNITWDGNPQLDGMPRKCLQVFNRVTSPQLRPPTNQMTSGLHEKLMETYECFIKDNCDEKGNIINITI